VTLHRAFSTELCVKSELHFSIFSILQAGGTEVVSGGL